MTDRRAAYNALNRVEKGGYSTLSLDAVLSGTDLNKRDRAFVSALFYGVLENQKLLDYIISQNLSKPGTKIDIGVRIILRMGIYQILFMDKVPDSAAVNESVTLAKNTGLVRASGFINAVLRSFIRAGKKCDIPPREKDIILHLSIKYSVPEWLTEKWVEDYGIDICESVLKELPGRPPIYARVNTNLINTNSLVDLLEKDGIKANGLTWIGDAVEISECGDIEQLDCFKKGLFHVQDAASQLCCKFLDPEPGEVICDVCAAPGGKSFTLSQYLGDSGHIYSYDIYENKISLLKSGAERLKLRNITASVRDARSGSCDIKADRVLCDVPCSGLGIIRRKPDIKNKKPADLKTLPELQLEILENSSRLLKDGGVLVYSTCTLSPEENIKVVEAFLKKHNDFEPYDFDAPCSRIIDEPKYMLTLFPHLLGTDGFFISRMRKKVRSDV